MRIIQTLYKHTYFRSRTEARWAVFFDCLQINWLYEEEGVILDGNVFYLPDFYLPVFENGMYVEVKGKFTDEEKKLCEKLCLESGKNILLAEGTPTIREYEYLVKNIKEKSVDWFYGLPNANKAIIENRMFSNTGLSDLTFKIRDQNLSQIDIDYLKAIVSARSARFEHGESGTFPLIEK